MGRDHSRKEESMTKTQAHAHIKKVLHISLTVVSVGILAVGCMGPEAERSEFDTAYREGANPDIGPRNQFEPREVECITDRDCPAGYSCSLNQCVLPEAEDGSEDESECSTNSDCLRSERCLEGICVALLPAPDEDNSDDFPTDDEDEPTDSGDWIEEVRAEINRARVSGPRSFDCNFSDAEVHNNELLQSDVVDQVNLGMARIFNAEEEAPRTPYSSQDFADDNNLDVRVYLGMVAPSRVQETQTAEEFVESLIRSSDECAQLFQGLNNTALSILEHGGRIHVLIADAVDSQELPDDSYEDEDFSELEFKMSVLELINQHRLAGTDCPGFEGQPVRENDPVGALQFDPRLEASAERHSQDMANNNIFSHTGSDGSSPFERMEDAGWSLDNTAGESIASGQRDAAQLVAAWMSSSGHCSLAMNPRFTHAGLGVVLGGTYGIYHTINYGGL